MSVSIPNITHACQNMVVDGPGRGPMHVRTFRYEIKLFFLPALTFLFEEREKKVCSQDPIIAVPGTTQSRVSIHVTLPIT